MGCTQWKRQQESESAATKPNQNDCKNSFYLTTEFDLPSSESGNEGESPSIHSTKNNKQQLKQNKVSSSNKLNSANETSTTAVNSIINNQLVQSRV